MKARQKFWLKTVATVTFPLWIAPAVAIGAAVLIYSLIWTSVSYAIDEFTGPRK